MSTSTIVVIVAVIVVLALAALLLRPMMRRRRLQQKFGPEYERTVETRDSRGTAERELLEREKRFASLDIRPLPDEARENYAKEWAAVQARFVDAPEDTIREADQLVTRVMADRGYPTEGYDQQLADLSVEHAQTLHHYRTAHDTRERIGAGVSTEDLRTALVHYRALFADLLGTGVGAAGGDGRDVRATEREQERPQERPVDVRTERPVDDRTGRHAGHRTE